MCYHLARHVLAYGHVSNVFQSNYIILPIYNIFSVIAMLKQTNRNFLQLSHDTFKAGSAGAKQQLLAHRLLHEVAEVLQGHGGLRRYGVDKAHSTLPGLE